MNIYLIRHGKKREKVIINDFGYPDQELSDLGIIEASSTGKYFSSIELDAIYASDLIRTIQTATYIQQFQQVKDIIIDERIREINMGILHTSTEDEVRIQYPQFYLEFMSREIDFTYPKGECGRDVKLRVLEFFDDVTNKEYENVAVVCHGGVIRSILSHLLGMEQHSRFKINPSNCGISLVEYNKGYDVISINETMHLKGNVSL